MVLFNYQSWNRINYSTPQYLENYMFHNFDSGRHDRKCLDHLFFIVTLIQSIFGLFIPKRIIKRLLVSHTLIFVENYHAGPPNYDSKIWTKTDRVYVGL